MSSEEAQERVSRILAEEMYLEVPAPDVDLFDSGVLDSLAFVELLVHLEEEFGRRISLGSVDLEDLQTIEKIARLMSTNGQRP